MVMNMMVNGIKVKYMVLVDLKKEKQVKHFKVFGKMVNIVIHYKIQIKINNLNFHE